MDQNSSFLAFTPSIMAQLFKYRFCLHYLFCTQVDGDHLGEWVKGAGVVSYIPSSSETLFKDLDITGRD